MRKFITDFENGFIVSCQAVIGEPLYGPHIMAAMALAAQQGGACGIRANSPEDIAMIKSKCSLPVIGIYKKLYPDSEVYITPTIEDVKEIVDAGADLVAIDSTKLPRPGGTSLKQLVNEIRMRYPALPIVADVSTYEEGVYAMDLGADLVSTTMSGYTAYSKQQTGPDIELVERLAALRRTPVLSEGRIWTLEDCTRCFDAGAYAVVVGTAITRPQEIIKRFVSSIKPRNGIL